MKMHTRRIFRALVVVTASLPVVVSCSVFIAGEDAVHVNYPVPAPEADRATVFLPGIVSGDANDFGSAFSPDGTAFYFARSANGRSQLFVSAYRDGAWQEAAPVPVGDTTYAFADPAFGADGNLYFISTMPVDQADTIADYDIWMVSPVTTGEWSTPQNVGLLNSDSSEYYISFADNGNLYFSSSRAGGFGSEDIYMSEWRNGEYAEPRNLGPEINTAMSEYDPGISNGEGIIVFTSTGRPDSFGKGDLYAASMTSGKWNPSVHLDSLFNTPSREYCSYFSPDNRFFFFSSNGQIMWIDAASILKKYLFR